MESEIGVGALSREIEEAFANVAVAGVETPATAEIEPWCGLSPAGFRSALPEAMLQVLKGEEGRGLRWWLTLPLSGDEEIYLSKWSALDARQRTCVARFLLAMRENSRDDEASLWEEAYESYWEP